MREGRIERRGECGTCPEREDRGEREETFRAHGIFIVVVLDGGLGCNPTKCA